jgi:enoyl-CoA hydratase
MLDQEKYEHIIIDKDDGIALLTLNRPAKLNAVNARLHSELSMLFADIQADHEVLAAVITGAGRGFCSGGDFSSTSGLDLSPRNPQQWTGLNMGQETRRIIDTALSLEKPLIAAVNGPAAGLGATIALLCDIIVIGRTARIGDPHAKMGLTAGDGGAFLWPLAIGVHKAKWMLMTGDLIDGEEAARIGLVNKVVDDDQVVNEAKNMARRLAAGAPYAVQSSKIAVNNIIRLFATTVLPASIPMEEVSIQTRDHEEAVKAFQEKRPAKFIGA